MKKLISILLSVIMLLSAVSCVFASAEGNINAKLKVRYGQTEARSMLSLINEFRTGSDAWYWNSDNKTKTVKTNLGTLQYDYELEETAMQRAAEIAIYFDHTRPNGNNWRSLVTSRSSAGENLAAGTTTAQAAFTLLQETDEPYAGQGHRRNMLDGAFTAVGIGHVVYNGVHYWVQEFGSPKSDMESSLALDGEKLVDVEINPSFVKTSTVSPSVSSLKVHVGKEIELPSISLSFQLTETWPAKLCTASSDADWSVENSSLAKISDGKVTGLSAGETLLKASVAGSVGEIKLTVTDHSPVTIKAVPATCTQKGLTEGKKCSVCGEILVAQTPTDILPHKYEKTDEKLSCTEKGIITYTCYVCGDVQLKETEPLGHKNAYGTKGLSATCTEDGFTGGTYCPDCKEYLSGHETIKAEGHKPVVYSEMVPATCFSVGHTAETRCERCGEKITASRVIEKLPHTFKEYIPNDDATCSKDGTQSGKCEICGAVDTIPVKDSKKEHTVGDFVIENIKHGCTEDGSHDEVYYCTVCGEEVSRETVVTPPDGHVFIKYVYNLDATCTKDGTMKAKCEYCDETDSVAADGSKLGHNYSDIIEKATFSKNGKITTVCSFCGDVSKTKTIASPDIASLSSASFTYNGKVQKPSVTVYDKSGSVISNKYYSVTYSVASSKSVGAYSLKITFKGNYSGSKELKYNILPQKVTSLKADKISSDSITLKWNSVTGAKYYKVEQSTDGKTWKTVKTVSTNTLIISKLTAGKKYQFRVTALDSSKKLSGKVSSVLKTATLTKATTLTLKSTDSKTAVASWKKVSGASKYVVYKSTDGKKWTKVTTTTKVGCTITKLSGGKKIYVKVTALNAYGKESAPSAVKNVTVKK